MSRKREHDHYGEIPRSSHSDTPLFADPSLNFVAEDGFLHGCDIHSESLERRVRSAHSNVHVFRMGRAEMQLIADNYARCVAIAKAYHLAEANRRAAKDSAA